MTIRITVTPTAHAYLEKCLKKEKGSHFRLSIKKTGCSGYSYAPSIVTEASPTDLRVQVEKGMCILIDPTWLSLLNNVCIDYIEEEKSGLKQKKLIFTNPNESNRCGCGESFHVDKVNS